MNQIHEIQFYKVKICYLKMLISIYILVDSNKTVFDETGLH